MRSASTRHRRRPRSYLFVWLGLVGLLGVLGVAGCDDDEGGAWADDRGATADARPVDAATDAATDGRVPDMAALPGALSIANTTLEFGTAAVRGRVEATLVVQNTGGGPLQVTAFEGLAAPFSSARMPPISVPAGAERSLIFGFNPQAAGPAEQIIEVVSDVPGAAPIAVTLRGAAVVPEAELVESRLDFGVVVPGSPGARFLEVRNLSAVAELTVEAVTGLTPPFAVAPNQVPATAAPGSNARVLVQFTPEADGDFERAVQIRTNAGDFDAVVVGRAVATGELVVRGAEPAWAPTDEAVTVVVHGGPFDAAPSAVLIGGVALTDLTLVDAERVQGTLPADAAPAPGVHDVRVELGARFGVAAGAFVRTGPVAEGATLDAAALAAGPTTPAGNPWRLDLAEVPAGTTWTVAPGTVVLASGPVLVVSGVLRAGGEGGPVVFSAASRTLGAWGGLALGANESPSDLVGVVLEYAGFDGSPALAVDQAANLTRLTVRQAAADGVEVRAAGVLSLLGGDFTDVGGDGVTLLTATGGIFRLNDGHMRRVGWPVAARPEHFGQRPLGLQDWAQNQHLGIGLGGTIAGAVTLTNQPEGVRYQVRAPIEVAAGGALTLAGAAPLLLDGPVRVAGRLTLPPGLTVQTAPGGKLVVQTGGTLVARGTQADRITLQARTAEAATPGQWEGLFLEAGGTLDVENLTLRDGGATPSAEPGPGPGDTEKGELPVPPGANLHLTGAFGTLRGLALEGSAQAGAIVAADGSLLNTRWAQNAGPSAQVVGGTGRISGITEDTAVPALEFVPVDLCAAWEVPAFRFPDMTDAPTNCPR